LPVSTHRASSEEIAAEPVQLVSLAAPAVWAPVAPRVADFVALTKPRLNLLVVATAVAGFYLAADGPVASWLLVHTLLGTWLVAGAAAAFNQVYERDTDALMRRTRHRPVPDGRIHPLTALRFAWILACAGLVELALGANLLAAAVALLTLASYTLAYTPLKRYTSLSTLVGGIPGGLPPVIGWAAARQSLSLEAGILFAIVFLWQMPHFLAIAWMCRDDYRRANIPMLPVVEPEGVVTAIQVVLYSGVLVPVSLLPAVVGLAGQTYLVAAVALGIGFLGLALQFARSRDLAAARRLFLGSVVYLPLIWAAMLLNHAG
jgi:protoheme IX farnesyltransferase